ncbi:MAG: peptide deformylase [Gammaproteobacteria bacterium]|nr:peptide deformylase [Gammaproteobacteria bacterium]
MIYPVVCLPDPVLFKKTDPVVTFDAALQTLIDDMFETMYHAKGVGLAAPQIGLSLNLAVVDVIGDKSEQFVLINPEVVATDGTEQYQEGCLSVPGVYATVTRAASVTIRAIDRTGKPFEKTADGLLGECFQHEIDHLNGHLFIDLLSPLKRAMLRRKYDKFKRSQRA